MSLNPLKIVGSASELLGGAADRALGAATRASKTVANASEWIRHRGGFKIEEEYTPYRVMSTGTTYRLRRYFPDSAPTGLPAIVFVPPLMIRADVYDISERSSPVRSAHDNGLDVWVVDFGEPAEEPGGLDRTVADHVLALSEVVDYVRASTGQNVVLSGYSQGGLFSYQTTAYRHNEGVDSIVTFGAMVDFQSGAPLPLPMSPGEFEKLAQGVLDLGVFKHVSMPGWANLLLTKAMAPAATLEFYRQYFSKLHDRDALMRSEKQRQFLDQRGWTAYPGPALEELMEYIAHNRLLKGGVVVGDRMVALADLKVPIFIAVGERDPQGPPRAVRAIRDAAPLAEVFQLTLDTGHFGIIASSGAKKWTWPRVAQWIRWRAGADVFPDGLVPVDEVTSRRSWAPSLRTEQVRRAIDLGFGGAWSTVKAASDIVDASREAAKEGARLIPMVNRLDALRPTAEFSLGLLLDEAAGKDLSAVALIHRDRAIRRGQLKERIDTTVRGLIALGVRQGDRVGVLMGPAPAGLCVLAAISRLGAVAVLPVATADPCVQLATAETSFVVTDLQYAEQIRSAGLAWGVLTDDAGAAMPKGAVDLAARGSGKGGVPGWYRPNPGRGRDQAFVVFDRGGSRFRVIGNGTWARAALGVARSIDLKAWETVYAPTAFDDHSMLTVAIGGSLVAGASIAFPTAPDLDSFWTDVRRYGITHVAYQGDYLKDLLEREPHPLERGAPIANFVGTCLPVELWERAIGRFPDARVREFHFSLDGRVALGNVAGVTVGPAGGPLPGAAAVTVVEFDPATSTFVTDSNGMARECRAREPGLLVVRALADAAGEHYYRGLLRPGDAWLSSGELFQRDKNDDLWFLGAACEPVGSPSKVAGA